MNETLEQIRRALLEMWHRRWIGLAAAWIVALIGIAVVYRIPERYEASARLFVDTETLLRPLLRDLAVQPNVDQQVGLISRTLISRPNVEKVVRMSDLDLHVASDAQRNALVDETMRGMKLVGTTRTNLYTISFRHTDGEQARKVVQSMLTIFVESSLGDKRQDARTAVRFIDEQIRQYESQLQAAENRLKEFRLKYMGVAPGQGDGFFTRMAVLRGEIEAAQLALSAAQRQRDAYKEQLRGEQPVLLSEPGAPQVEVVPEIDSRLATLRTSLDDLRRRFTDEHPDVQGVRRVIEQLEADRRAEVDKRRKAAAEVSAPKPVDRNPVFQQLRMSLAEAEAQVAAQGAKVQGLEAQYARLLAQSKLVPEIEAEHAQLNRDYEVQKKTYETLLSRRESAAMGIGAQDTGAAQFRVIDPPRVGQKPVAPDRLLLLGVALGAALAAGLAAAFAAAQLAPTFHDTRTLRDFAKRPVVGAVMMLQTAALRRRRRRVALLFAGGTTALFLMFATVAVISMYGWRVLA